MFCLSCIAIVLFLIYLFHSFIGVLDVVDVAVVVVGGGDGGFDFSLMLYKYVYVINIARTPYSVLKINKIVKNKPHLLYF